MQPCRFIGSSCFVLWMDPSGAEGEERACWWLLEISWWQFCLGSVPSFSRATVIGIGCEKEWWKKTQALLIFLCQKKLSGFGYLHVGLIAALIRELPDTSYFSKDLAELLQKTFGHTRPRWGVRAAVSLCRREGGCLVYWILSDCGDACFLNPSG